MTQDKFNFELVTPEKVLVSGDVEYVCIPGVEGDMTVFPNHSSVATAIRPGYLQVKSNENLETFFLSGGFVEISYNEVIVLAEKAVISSEVTDDILTDLIEKTDRALEHSSELQRCVLSKKLNDLTSIKDQLQK